MSLLLIDIGNTSIHWAAQETGQTLSPMQTCIYRDQEIDKTLTSNMTGMIGIESIYISSVANEKANQSIQEWFLSHWKISPQFIISKSSGYGVNNAYAVPEQLGSDRWAAMVGAYHLCPAACCVLDCGTAVTLDVVNSGGQHLGGWIMPGYRLFQQALSQETAGINANNTASTSNLTLGNNTEECIDVAWHQSILALTQRTLSETKLQNINCYITGGDAERLVPLLGKEWCYANDLVLQGLAVMASQD